MSERATAPLVCNYCWFQNCHENREPCGDPACSHPCAECWDES